jgi:hypothetical protein
MSLPRLFVLDHKVGNRGGDPPELPDDASPAEVRAWENAMAMWEADPHPHIYRVAYWVLCPDALRGKGQVSIVIPSRTSARGGGVFKSNVEGQRCDGCPNQVEPLTHAPHATEEEKNAIRSGEVLEFVVDEAGGQMPDHWGNGETFDALMKVAHEIEAALKDMAARYQLPQRQLIGSSFHLPAGG